jgi:hypothetical protein
VRWVPGVSIGEEGGTFWPWHRARDHYFELGHHRIGASVVTTCRDCGAVLAVWPGAKGRKSGAIAGHDNLHRQITELQEHVEQINEMLGIGTGDDDDGDTDQSPESGYIEPGYDVRELGPGKDTGDDE